MPVAQHLAVGHAVERNPAGTTVGPEVAATLDRLIGGDAGKVFFANSGSEANDTQIKLFWYVNNARGRSQKKKIISRAKAYHGVTMVAASLTGLPANHKSWDLPFEFVKFASCPHYYRAAEAGESEEQFTARMAALRASGSMVSSVMRRRQCAAQAS